MVTPIKPHAMDTASHTALPHSTFKCIDSFLDKHVAAPLEGIGKGLTNVGERLTQGAAATVFDHVQRTFAPLAVISQPAFVKKAESFVPAHALLNVVSAAGETHRAFQQAQQNFSQDPLGSAMAFQQSLGDALWRNPLETRDDVVKFFETLTPLTLMLPLRTASVIPTSTVTVASKVGPTPTLLGKGRVIEGEWSVVKATADQGLGLRSAPRVRSMALPDKSRAGQMGQGAQAGQTIASKSVVLPTFSSLDNSLNWETLPTSMPPVEVDHVVHLPRAHAIGTTALKKQPLPQYLGVQPNRFDGLHGIEGFKAALKMPPPDLLPSDAGATIGPQLEGSSVYAGKYFEGMPMQAQEVISLVGRIPAWDKVNYAGRGRNSYLPLPIKGSDFAADMKALYDPRWFKTYAENGEFVIKALGNNTFHLDRQGVLRYALHPVSSLDEHALLTAIAGLLNHYGAKGLVPTVTAVQTYSELVTQGWAAPLMNGVTRNSAKWLGFTEYDLREARLQRQANPNVEPAVQPSLPWSTEDRAYFLFEVARDIGRHADTPFAHLGMQHPLMLELAKLGDKNIWVMTYGRRGMKRTWKIPSVNDPARSYRYEPEWTSLHKTDFPTGLRHQLPPDMYKRLDRQLFKPWQAPGFDGEIPSNHFEFNVSPEGTYTSYTFEDKRLLALSNNGHLTYDIEIAPTSPTGIAEASLPDHSLRENLIYSLLRHLRAQGQNPAHWVVKLVPNDPDSERYLHQVERGATSAEALQNTDLGRAMMRMHMPFERVLRFESEGEKALRVQFSNRFHYQDSRRGNNP